MSQRTAEQAASLGIPLSVLDDHPKVMVAVKPIHINVFWKYLSKHGRI